MKTKPLVIVIEYTKIVLKKDPLMLALGLTEVGRALHWLIQEQTGIAEAGDLATSIVSFLSHLEKNSPPNHNDWSYVQGL